MQHLASLNGLSLGNNLLALGKDQLDVAGVRHVWVDLERQLDTCSTCCSQTDKTGGYLRDRVHGMCGGAALVPG